MPLEIAAPISARYTYICDNCGTKQCFDLKTIPSYWNVINLPVRAMDGGVYGGDEYYYCEGCSRYLVDITKKK